MSSLRQQKEVLERRLDAGWDRIDVAHDNESEDTIEKWTTFWITLLAEYEDVCDQLMKELANEHKNPVRR
jgi:hypothetical protein